MTLVKVMLDLDVYTSVGLRKVLVDLIKQGRYFLVIDLTEVEYLDSTGLGVIVGALKYVRAFEGALALVVPYEPAVKQFRITGLTKVFPIFRSVDPAVEFLGREVLGAHARR
ncbi:STAS domain-containing protein [Streptomyces davaonensis]|uniref:STAS domain-containing protein n=1 Tax=Streptomyces davaonensis TaxID=348043 RepID=UPI0022B23AEF|nr:STAS domain-containing protein [Streptomyces davaonensis]